MNDNRYTSVDDLQAQMSLTDAAAKCGVSLEVHGSGKQIRLDCPFGCPGDHISKREISVDTGNPQKVFCCHAYGCQVRGNLLTLMHGWSTGSQPAGGRLKGAEFKRVRDVLCGSSAQSEAGGDGSTRRRGAVTIMDPDATLKLLLEAIVEKNCADIREMSRALLEWLEKGGFPPKTIGPWKLGQDWHVSMARHICAEAELMLHFGESSDK